jgi:hypothetical protein
VNPAIPEALETLLLRLLAKDPEQRPGSMGVVAQELRRIGEALPPEPPQSLPPLLSTIKLPPAPTTLSNTAGMLEGAPRAQGRQRLAVLATVAGLTVALGAGLLLVRPTGDVRPRGTGILLHIEGGWAVPSTLADDVTRAVRRELERRKRIALLPGDDQLALRQATGCAAPEPACVARAARREGAKLAVYGSVSREQADRYRLDLVLLDAETATIVHRVSDDFDLDAATGEVDRRAPRWADVLGGDALP